MLVKTSDAPSGLQNCQPLICLVKKENVKENERYHTKLH